MKAHADALAELAAERYEQMVGYARKRLQAFGVPPSSADPQDVVQIALTKVLTCQKRVEKLRPYVFTVIKNEVNHAARRYRAGLGYGTTSADVRLESAGPAVHPIAAADLRMDLEAAMSRLPPQQRTAMHHKARGDTQAETAAAMGTAPGTVATHVSRAVVTLRMTLQALLGVVLVVFAAAWLQTSSSPADPASGGDLMEQLKQPVIVGMFALGSALLALSVVSLSGFRTPSWVLRLLRWMLRRQLSPAARSRPEPEPNPEPERPRGAQRGQPMSERERCVAVLAVKGRSNREIAREMFLNVKAVEGHLANVYIKLGIRSRVELVHRLEDDAAPYRVGPLTWREH